MEDSVLKKKPQSLNQRHNHLLSASRSRPVPESKPRPDHFNVNIHRAIDDFPSFSGIADFDSSPGEEMEKHSEFVLKDRVGAVPSFAGIVDFDSDDSKLLSHKQFRSPDSVESDAFAEDRNPNFSYSALDKPKPEAQNAKPGKVKIEGKRRLCKLSTQNDDGYKDENNQLQDISDFSSPPRPKEVASNIDGGGGGGGKEIRDILDELSSRLEFMSIEKKRNTRPVDHRAAPLDDDSLDVVTDKVGYQKKGEMGEFEFTSAGSSFAGSSDSSTCGSDNMQNKERESEPNINNFDGVAKTSRNVDKGKLITADKKENTNRVVSRGNFVSTLNDDSDEDDCIMLGSGKLPKKDQHGGVPKKDYTLPQKTIKDYTKSSASEVLDDDANEAVSEKEHAITLNGPRSTYKLPAKIGKMLYPHQRDGLKWLWSLHCQGKGGILGDDMGLGKTMQISGYLAGLFNSCLVKRVMIVAPKTLMPHWIKELTVVGLSQKIKEYFGTCPKLRQYELQSVLQDKGILLTTYDIVRNNVKQLCRTDGDDDCEDGSIWDYMILDEGHLIKNPSTQRAKSLLEVPCSNRIIISGTPIQNNLKELWALFSFCCPDLLGDKKWFKDKYENPVLRGNDKNASERDRRIGSMVAKELRERIQPYFLRRMKSEVFREDGDKGSAKLSKKNEVIVWLRLTGCQRHLYEAFLKSEIVLSAFDGSPLAAITILKKICDHPSLITKRAADELLEGMDSELNQEDRGLAEKLAKHAANLTVGDDFGEKHDNVSCKISFILSLLGKLIPEGHSVLIFSQTRKMLNLIQESLVTNGFEFLRIDGTTKAADRLKIVNEFQEGNSAPIFLLTSQVGGLGLTLTKADRVIVADPAWNPSTDSQSVDRAYRIGQKKDVIVYRLMTCGTIEEKIYRMQVFKGGLFKTATEHKEQTRYFTQQDLKELFRLPKDGFDISTTQQQLHAEHGHQISMSDYLKDHIKFLESLGIGGVSHHSLLFSKSEPTPPDIHVEEAARRTGTTGFRHFGSSSTEHPVDSSQYAFNPKNINLHKKAPSPEGPYQMTESAIKERINRLSQLLSNQVTVSRLPDRGEKLRKQIADLNSELNNLTTPTMNEVIDLDDIADELQRSLHV